MSETLVTKKVSLVLYSIMTDFEISQRILKTAHELFMQFGFRSVGMDDIATRLGISKKTIYQHYVDKDELVVAAVKGEIEHSELCCTRDKELAKNAIHEMFLALEMVLEMFSRMNPSLLFDMQKYHPKAFAIIQKHKNDFIYSVIKDNLEWGIKDGLYRAEINIEIMTRFRVESMLMPFSNEFLSNLRSTIAEMEEEMIIHYLYGLVTPKGYKLISKYQADRTIK
jgi:AcrR family transcriptional regulator